MNVLERIKSTDFNNRLSLSLKSFYVDREGYYSEHCIDDIVAMKELIGLAEIGEQMQWIRVEDQLPNFNGKVIACIDGRNVMGCSFNNDAKQFFNIQNLKNVTHWMKLPTSPTDTK